jgi:hypothetical protein
MLACIESVERGDAQILHLSLAWGYSPAWTAMSNSYSTLKVIIALSQALLAISTLHQTRGDQIKRYGYAALGLAAIPYAFMSIANLIGNFCQPTYSSIFLVESNDMRDLVKREEVEYGHGGGLFTFESKFKGVVQVLDPEYERDIQSFMLKEEKKAFRLVFPAMIIGGVVPVIIIGALTHFHVVDSILAQRVWIMLWIFLGSIFGPIVMLSPSALFQLLAELFVWLPPIAGIFSLISGLFEEFGYLFGIDMTAVFVVPLCAPAVGGFVVVGQMISHYSICTRI